MCCCVSRETNYRVRKKISGAAQPSMDEEEVVREEPPAHYAIRIESLSSLRSMLAKCEDRRFSSTEFSAGGRNWVLIVDLNGEKDDAGDGHISMYLKLVDKLKPGEVVNAVFTFLVYNQKLDNYFTKQDRTGKCFRPSKTEWGISKVLSLSTFNDPVRGYVVNDCCVLGAEVFVRKNDFEMGALSLVSKDNVNHSYSWTVSQYSKFVVKCVSPIFSFDGISWTLLLYPRGIGKQKGKSISIYLCLDDHCNLSIGGQKVFVEYEIILKDQFGDNDIKKCDTQWFQADVKAGGYSAFFPLSDLKDPFKCYLLKDELIIQVNVKTVFRLQNA